MQAVLRRADPRHQFVALASHHAGNFLACAVDPLLQRCLMAVELLGERRSGNMEGLIDRAGALRHEVRNARAGSSEVFVQRAPVQGDGFVHAVAGFSQARRQAIAAQGNIIGNALAGFIQPRNDIIAAHA